MKDSAYSWCHNSEVVDPHVTNSQVSALLPEFLFVKTCWGGEVVNLWMHSICCDKRCVPCCSWGPLLKDCWNTPLTHLIVDCIKTKKGLALWFPPKRRRWKASMKRKFPYFRTIYQNVIEQISFSTNCSVFFASLFTRGHVYSFI